ncbi:hypothetical protein K491DRAFT_719672 [Lophiostoma macrostomum CBS 122681]|uniref:Uncharacterized protein n=1 Tax=Lophiostoma macrostomum CBS 122681 TaxID=1314788 RepID=A0A6A6SYR8_9PLEO|nr:hypothetical protein K491DRAFT_719672 [Lophiostoma macrostomum CBS 122681]
MRVPQQHRLFYPQYFSPSLSLTDIYHYAIPSAAEAAYANVDANPDPKISHTKLSSQYQEDHRRMETVQFRGLRIGYDGESFTLYLTFSMNAGNDRGRSALTVPVRVPRRPNSKSYDVENPTVKWDDKWLSCKEFLHAAVHSTPPFTPVGKEGYSFLWEWYQKNGKTVRFMTLPSELRLVVCEFAVGGEVYPRIKKLKDTKYHVSFGAGWVPKAPRFWLKNTHDPDDEIPPPNLVLLELNKEMRLECQKILSGSRYYFAELSDLHKSLEYKRSPIWTVTHIGLNLEYPEYFEFFGVVLALDDRFESVETPLLTTTKMGRLPNLAHLSLKFRSTCWLMDTCQKTVTIWILSLALEYVKHFKSMTVEGYIKNSVKEGFQSASEVLRKNSEATLTWGISRARLLSLGPDAIPPECHCRTPCGFWGVKTLLDREREGRRRRIPYDTTAKIFKQYKFDYDD